MPLNFDFFFVFTLSISASVNEAVKTTAAKANMASTRPASW